jgi:hypothetical protein
MHSNRARKKALRAQAGTAARKRRERAAARAPLRCRKIMITR